MRPVFLSRRQSAVTHRLYHTSATASSRVVSLNQNSSLTVLRPEIPQASASPVLPPPSSISPLMRQSEPPRPIALKCPAYSGKNCARRSGSSQRRRISQRASDRSYL
ncbi:TPA: hypothetical protein ACE8EQ_001392 [Neisseria gonorrhoeae]